MKNLLQVNRALAAKKNLFTNLLNWVLGKGPSEKD